MKTISSLPDNHDDVNAMIFLDMVQTVVDLAHPDTQIQGRAGMQVNAFLSYAAVRMAKHIQSKPVVADHIDTVNM